MITGLKAITGVFNYHPEMRTVQKNLDFVITWRRWREATASQGCLCGEQWWDKVCQPWIQDSNPRRSPSYLCLLGAHLPQLCWPRSPEHG